MKTKGKMPTEHQPIRGWTRNFTADRRLMPEWGIQWLFHSPLLNTQCTSLAWCSKCHLKQNMKSYFHHFGLRAAGFLLTEEAWAKRLRGSGGANEAAHRILWQGKKSAFLARLKKQCYYGMLATDLTIISPTRCQEIQNPPRTLPMKLSQIWQYTAKNETPVRGRWHNCHIICC